MKTGGAAKGELVLAIYELANCFRHGWGVARDPIAARKYYETAANLGDTDAMNEAARCYEEGFGGKKDKVSQRARPGPCRVHVHHHINHPKQSSVCQTTNRSSSLGSVGSRWAAMPFVVVTTWGGLTSKS